MSRTKLQNSMWREGHRKSPRISQKTTTSATASPGTHTRSNTSPTRSVQEMGNGQGPASRTGAGRKRKLRPVEEVTATSLSTQPQQGGSKPSNEDEHTNNDQPVVAHSEDSPRHEDHAAKTNQPFQLPSAPWMPEKRVLQLILDILQRRDTHEIFAEPVDPNEVEDYYEIIVEPMDFGTMRAKLHEGMYRSLEQFEHDVFLIPKNAMHFNSSATLYFRQARALHELAKKIFHVLKTDPGNFELEFSDTGRKRSRRRRQGETRCSIKSPCPKLPTNVKSSGKILDVSSEMMPSLANSSDLRSSFRPNSRFSVAAPCIDAIDHDVLSGEKDGTRLRSFIPDQRVMHRPWMSFLNENETIISTIYGTSKPLQHVNQQDFSYKESLMLFVKDLGPTAQMVAEKKLQFSADTSKYQTSNNWFQAQNCHTNMEANVAQRRPSTSNTTITTPKSKNVLDLLHGQPSVIRNSCDRINFGDADKGQEATVGDKCVSGDIVAVALNRSMSVHGALDVEVHASDEKKILGDHSCEVRLDSYSFTAGVGDLNCLVAKPQKMSGESAALELSKGGLDHEAQFLESASKCSKSNVPESLLGKNYSSPSSWTLQTTGDNAMSSSCQVEDARPISSLEYLMDHDEVIAAQGGSDGACRSSVAGQTSKQDQPMPQASQFVFDLPYLRTRLDQTSALGSDRFSQQLSPCSKGPPFPKMSYQRGSSCSQSSRLEHPVS